MAFADTQKLVVELDLKGNLNAKLGEAARAIKGFDRATSNTQQSLSRFGRNLERGIALGATAAVGGFVAVAKAAGDFESQMNTIATIVDRKDIARIGNDLRKTARETGLGLEDLTSAYYDLASAGVKGQLATEALNDAVKLGIGGLATTAETVNLMTTAINAYGLDAAGAAKATDQFALAIADGVVHADEIAATFADVASIAKTYKIGIDQIATSYAFLTKQGVPAGEVTTEMQRAIISLINPTKDLETAQKKLGISFTKEIATKGLVGALQELRQYSDKTGIPLIALLGRIEAVKYTLQTTGPEFKGYNAELAKMGQASGVAAAQMAERQQGLNYQLKILKAGLKDAAITIGSALLPKLTPLVAKLNEFLGANQGKIADFAGKLADQFQKFSDAVQKVDWKPFIDGLKLSGEIAKDIISAFRSLPEDLQKLVVAGFALNKVTGGLGTSIVKDIGGALLNNFAKRGGSPAMPLFVKEVGLPGIPGAAAPAAAAGAGGVGLLGAVGAVAVPTILIGGAAVSLQDIASYAGLNNQLAAKGLSFNEITAYKFYTSSLAEQETARKHLVNMPSKADFESAMAKLQGAVVTSGVAGTTAIVNAATGFTTGLEKLTPGKEKDDIVNLAQLQKSALAFLRDQFREMLAGIRRASSPAQIKAAIASIEKNVFQRGKGGTGGARDVITALKGLLLRTDDPKSRAAIQGEIKRMERQLNYRTIVAAQLKKADQIFHSSESTKRKIEELKGVQRSLNAKDLAAQRRVQEKIDALKRAETYAQRATTEAIKDKDLSVRVNTNVITNVSVSTRDVYNGQQHISKYFSTVS